MNVYTTHSPKTKLATIIYLDVTVALSIVDVAELGGALAVGDMRLEDAASTLTLTTDNATHGDCNKIGEANQPI